MYTDDHNIKPGKKVESKKKGLSLLQREDKGFSCTQATAKKNQSDNQSQFTIYLYVFLIFFFFAEKSEPLG